MADFTPSLKHRVEEFLKRDDYRPLKQHELARALGVKGGGRHGLRSVLQELEREGRAVKLRKNRWALPDTGDRVEGILRLHVHGFGFVVPEQAGLDDVYVPATGMGAALHGDRVRLRVTENPRPRKRRGGVAPDAGPRFEGRVESVLERGSTSIVGRIKRTPYYAYLIPDNPRFTRDVQLRETPDLKAEEDHKAVVRLDPWTDPATQLTGVVVEDLGKAGDPGVEMLSLIRDRGLDTEFSEAARKQVKDTSPTLSAESLEGRRDLRELLTFTIDPDDARDFDDAVSLETGPDDTVVLGVHIADVAHYVTPGSAVDGEAFERGTSVYLVDRVITMLPADLTTDICSLRPDEDRLTHSVFLTISGAGEVLSAETCRSVIHSRARLTYGQVQAYLDGVPGHELSPEVQAALTRMRAVASALRQKRVRAGAVNFAMPEVKCELDAQGEVTAIHSRGDTEAYQLIEDFMLAANQAVARRLDQGENPGLYRVHDAPEESNWAQIAAGLQGLGYTSAPSTREDLNQMVRSMANSPALHAAQLIVLRNLKRALYTTTRREHFGLAFQHYTHFTSPIRRYPDLLVHRILVALEQGQPAPYDLNQLERMAIHCSMKEREADEAERDSIDMMRVKYFERRLWAGETGPYSGLVVAMAPKGLVVELTETLQKGLVPFSSFPGEFYRVSPDKTQAVARRSRRTWRVGQPVEVELARVDSVRRLVDFYVRDHEGPKRARRKAAGPKRKRGQGSAR